MRSAEFLLSKDPVTESVGDAAMMRLLMDLASESMQVRYIALGPESARRGSDIVLAKGRPNPPRLLLGAARSRRSLVHERFDLPELRASIASRPPVDLYVAGHSYMAESLLAVRSGSPLYISTEISEALVWRATYGPLGRMQAPRIRRDELRTARAAVAVASYDESEAEEYRHAGVTRSHWIDVTLPPRAHRPERDFHARRVAFVGDRRWRPNAEALALLLRWWPAIARGIPGAELVIVGPSDGRRRRLPAGVRDLGFVPDLDALLGTTRGILAPIVTGGGVRVKILEATRRALAVVGTSAAIGSLDRILPLVAADTEDAFVDASRRLLLDETHARAAGDALDEANRVHWERRRPQTAVEEWLA